MSLAFCHLVCQYTMICFHLFLFLSSSWGMFSSHVLGFQTPAMLSSARSGLTATSTKPPLVDHPLQSQSSSLKMSSTSSSSSSASFLSSLVTSRLPTSVNNQVRQCIQSIQLASSSMSSSTDDSDTNKSNAAAVVR